MYAVVYNNRVIVGPMQWNRALFQGSLEREMVEASLPRVAPETLPLVINEDARILRVEEQRENLNQLVEYYYGPIWDVSGDTAIATYEVHDFPIETSRSNLKDKIAGIRWIKEEAGTKINIQSQEITLDTSREGRNIFLQKYSLMGENDLVNWKFPEGWFTLSKNELGSIIMYGSAYIQSCFDWEKTISDEIDAATTKEELLSIEIEENNQVE
jgi:hypothetical protein